MLKNPYSPVFGGKPDVFFGRKELLARFDVALVNSGSADRALFITGTRGSGKTALVERLSQRASAHGWHAIDLGPENTVEMLVRQLVRHQSTTSTVSPQVSASILGFGGGVGGVSSAKTITYDAIDLPVIVLEACKREKRGIFVSIDEVQKVSLDDMSSICNAFQLASRKGYNIILVVAGLPYAYNRVIHEEGCTFLRRGAHDELSLLTREEAREAFADSLRMVKGLSASEEQINMLVRASMGHPYMIQLLGYYLIATINDGDVRSTNEVADGEIDQAGKLALQTYHSRALKPMVDELSTAERDYLGAMVAVMDETHIADTAKVAAHLNKRPSALTRVRDKLLRYGIVVAPLRGKVRFAIPYLRDYVAHGASANSTADLLESWDV